jgi:hypothetical protein
MKPNKRDELAPTFAGREQRIVQRAIEAFKATTGLPAEIEAMGVQLPDKNLRADAIITLGAKPVRHTFVAEVKRIDRLAALAAVRNQLARGQLPHPGLLVAPYITAETADHCRKLRLPFLDTAGNAYLEEPGLFVFVKGQRKPTDDELAPQGKAATATALRVVFALLCQPKLLNAPYRDIARAAGVALGTVGWVLYDLDTRRFTTGGKDKKNRRILLERPKLIDEWTTNFPIKLRPKLNARRFTAHDRNWWAKVDLEAFGALWGGEVAADRYTNDLRPATVTIYIDADEHKKNLGRLIATHRLRPEPKGEIEFLDRFWHFGEQRDNQHVGRPAPKAVVPPLLAYADLIASLDPRNLQVARNLYDQWIADVVANA